MTRLDIPAPTTVEIVPFTEQHMPGALALSQAEGWPHRHEDWALSLSVSQGVAAVGDGRVLGTALCSLHGPVATLNLIIVDAAMRGRGLGRQMMQRVIELAGDREMRLAATEEGKPLYRKLGFRDYDQIVQLQGVATAARPKQVVHAGAVDTGILAGMDSDASGMERAALLARIASNGVTLSTDGGFALLRSFGRGHVLGPVVARDATAARSLFAAGATRMAGQFLRIDVFESHGLAPYVESLGLSMVVGCTAMVHSPRQRPASNYQTHALVSQALG
ncbi:GNAT family N-acetyltransferase [Roseinatronobacter alkalisoli]|uniref:GNAT family N-acetyltransferase n=1 Tax=Roseinatronobacter alkalisoli TaxID=3028235 RepID=A0ABT5TD00_9RHOB|nr:GNAT family N-acetyltransferase [Roseinatronobacter sp. HJB301]MDD7973002.1 GNAT family N-acetyltransferase [Roseinatronobacter sp. HJB301]